MSDISINNLEKLVQSQLIFLQTNPGDITTMYSIGNNLAGLGKWSEAVSYFERILNHDPKDHETLNAIGAVYLKMKKYDKAASVLKLALSLWTKEPAYHANFGDAMFAINQPDLARKAYEQALALALPGEDIVERLQLALKELLRLQR